MAGMSGQSATATLAQRPMLPLSGRLRALLRPWARQRLGAIGICICVLLVLIALSADVLAPLDPTAMAPDSVLTPPGSQFLLGSDAYGRDILSRLVHGTRISISVGITAALIGTALGALIALISGFAGGWIDMVIQRVMDAMMALPALILALTLVAVLGPSLINVIYAVAFALVPGSNRVIRSQVLSVRQRDYVTAAVALGASNLRVVFVHVLPNCLAPYLVIASAGVSTAILAEASLGFLGLGVPPPAPSWGSMLSTARDYVDSAPWVPILPGLAISVAVFGANVFGDALRDILDPRLRGSI